MRCSLATPVAKTTRLYFGSDVLATGNETVYLPLILRSHRCNSNEESRFRKNARGVDYCPVKSNEE